MQSYSIAIDEDVQYIGFRELVERMGYMRPHMDQRLDAMDEVYGSSGRGRAYEELERRWDPDDPRPRPSGWS